MVRIRLSRTGSKKQPSYRVVVSDRDFKRDGRVVERIGHYNPRTEPIEYKIEEDRALYWLSVGAQPSDAVRRLLTKQGTYDRLARLREGESLDDLVAEFSGGIAVERADAETPVAEEVEEIAEAVVEEALAAEEALEEEE